MTKPAVVGLDLSLQGAAGVLVPGDWEVGDWGALQTFHIGYEVKGGDLARRVARILDVADVVLAHLARWGAEHVAVEDYAWGQNQKTVVNAELAGHVKARAMRELGRVLVPVNQSTLRKYFLGKLPQAGRAQAVHVALRAMGVPWEDSDRGDALLVATYHRTEYGLDGLLAYG